MKMQSFVKLVVTSGMVLGLTVGCADTAKKDAEAATAAEAAKANQSISAAKKANKKAKSVGFEWRDTGKWIKKAEASAKKGDNKNAIKLAGKAKTEAELAYKQYILEKGIDRAVK